jgi:curved DNA-binding protein CbpA
MLQLHPDKNRNKDAKDKYIAEWIFMALNKANEEIQKYYFKNYLY